MVEKNFIGQGQGQDKYILVVLPLYDLYTNPPLTFLKSVENETSLSRKQSFRFLTHNIKRHRGVNTTPLVSKLLVFLLSLNIFFTTQK